jgi:pantoate--beta-alanine ligase
MDILYTIDAMRGWALEQRAGCKRIAFVPTMGALHDGHLSLMREGKHLAERLVVSIYVNPTQFSPTEDLSTYPRTLERDLAGCAKSGADAVFVPSDPVMYPTGFETFVSVENTTRALCGASRPTHFRGVTTVVAKLFNIVSPDIALFGEKDFQQLVVIRRMVKDLNMPVEVVGCPIVREDDGIAMSSRNKYLSPEERADARSLSASLNTAQRMIDSGETSSATILDEVTRIISSHERMRIDYAKIVDADTLEDMATIKRPALLALAAFAGTTRLIDNRCFR